MPAPWLSDEYLLPRRRLRIWVRGLLLVMAAVLVGVFVLAICLDPYKEGRVWLEGTHRQFGLPPCSFKEVTGWPCPSCGMTSSFALLIRGDVLHSLQANAVGTLLAGFLLVFIPWSVASAFQGRLLFIQSVEWVLIRLLVLFFVILLVRWVVVLVELQLTR